MSSNGRLLLKIPAWDNEAARAWGPMSGRGSAARFDSPGALAVDKAGTLYVRDRNNAALKAQGQPPKDRVAFDKASRMMCKTWIS